MTADLDRLRAALADRYHIERELGQGGMATVYLAQDLRHGRKVAIKVLKPELAHALGPERFLREVATTANLRHPHILPLYDSGESSGFLYYVMPLVEGESLRDRLTREKQLPIDEALAIAREVADALGYAHQRGVVHRDIKPENIMLEGGHAVVADFGIARALSSAGADRLTETGMAIGTPLYMSPEQAAGDPDLDGRSDLYSLGCVLYEMLGGQAPFTGPTAEVIARQHLLTEAAPITNLRPTVPPQVAGALARSLAKSPADRFNPAAQFVQALSGSSTTAAPSTPTRSAALPGRAQPVSRGKWLGLAAGLVLVLSVAGYVMARSGGPRGADAVGRIRSIAVLPLDNYSADSAQEFFAEGMTDELTTDLASISRLRVTSRGSAMQFKGTNRPSTPQIGKALNVDAIVEGSVSRSGDRVRITAQLIDARADKHLWARSFERSSSDVLALQADLASAIAAEINVQLTPGEQSRLASAPSVDPDAHDAYLKGRYFFNRPSDENLQKAIAQFDEAVRLSPDFALAYSGLSDAYLWAGYNEGLMTASDAKPRTRAAAERAVQLDSTSAEAHTSLGLYQAWYEHDWEASQRELRRAIELNPSYALAHDQLGQVLALVGRLEESIAEGRRAIELDPLSPSILVDQVFPFMFQRNVAAARELTRKASDLDPTFYAAPMIEGWTDLNAGHPRDAIPKLEKAVTMDAPPFVTAYLAYAYAASGDRARARAALDTLKKVSKAGRVAPYNLALVYLGLGDHDRALDNLEQAHASDSEFMVWLGQDHLFDPLRSEPRFVALLKQLNFAK
ncbi:MAG: protein kinase domain-containing protein [Gemmatimonadales bacterium]